MEDIDKKIEEKFKNREKKLSEESSELKRIKKQETIAMIMIKYDCSEEAAEKMLRERDGEESQEGE